MAGNISNGFCAAILLIVVVAPAGACNQSSSIPQGETAASDEVSKVSQALVGKQITIRGKFSLKTKITTASIWLASHEVVYLQHKGEWGPSYSKWEGKLVAVTGTLRFYHSPPAEPTAQHVARPPDHYYFDAETTQVRLIGH